MDRAKNNTDGWPALDWQEWQETAETLRRFTQIVGKTRLALTPMQNQWWNVTLYVTARGLSTSVMPLPGGDQLEIEFDFLAHSLDFRRSSGRSESLPLKAQAVADFYAAYQRILGVLGVEVRIRAVPAECQDVIPFDQDRVHASYDADAVQRFFRVVSRADILLKRFSAGFCGKVSPVHFFWGSMDLAATRFNGRRAPAREGADAVQREAYSHECISTGFWPGIGGYGRAAFYCYAVPVPNGLADAGRLGPGVFNKELGEFVLDYSTVQQAADPGGTVLEFLDASYAACAVAARWDRVTLERPCA